jgi:uncharacterized protein YbjT (DUF2867 family)
VVRSRVYAQTVLAQRARAIFFAICLPLWRFCCLTHFPFGSILGRMILVTGADNRLGYEVCRRLRAKGQRVRAWVPRAMPPNRIERLRATGVEFFPAELHNPAALVAACRDVEAVISTDAAMLPIDPSETFDRECARSLRDFTHILGGLQFICVTVPRRFRTKSVLVEEREEYQGCRHANQTILYANFFMETWLSPGFGFDYPNAKAELLGDGAQRSAMVSYKDVSEVAIRCLGRDGGKVELALDGPEDLSQLDVVHLFETALGRTFAVTHVSADALQAEYDKAPDPVTRARAALKIEYARGCPADGHLSRKRIPLELTSLRNYVSTLTYAAPANSA